MNDILLDFLLIGGIAFVILFIISVMDEDSLESLKNHIINKRLRYKVKNRTLKLEQSKKYLDYLFEISYPSAYPNKNLIKNAEDLDYVLNTYLLSFKINDLPPTVICTNLMDGLVKNFEDNLNCTGYSYTSGYRYSKTDLEIAKKYQKIAYVSKYQKYLGF